MDKSKVAEFQKRVRDAVVAINKEFGFELTHCTARYDTSTIAMGVKVRATDEETERTAFAECAPHFDMKPEHFGARFKSGAKTLRLVGLDPRRPAWPVVVVNESDGKRLRMKEAALALVRKQTLPACGDPDCATGCTDPGAHFAPEN